MEPGLGLLHLQGHHSSDQPVISIRVSKDAETDFQYFCTSRKVEISLQNFPITYLSNKELAETSAVQVWDCG